MKTILFTLLWLLALANIATSAHAATNRPLLVSARYYTPLSRPWDRSYYHLYRFNPDGSGKTQLTFANHDDVGACWSPNGKQVAFVRIQSEFDTSGVDIQVCVQAAQPHARTRVIARLHSQSYIDTLAWAGNGKALALVTGDKVIFLDARGKILRQMKNDWHSFRGFSPDGKHYVVETVDDNIYVVETLSGRKTRLANPCIWWDNKTLLSWKYVSTEEAEHTTSRTIIFTDIAGKPIRSVALLPTALQRKYFLEWSGNTVPLREVARVNPKMSLLYIGFGKPEEHLLVDIRNGIIRRWQGQDTGLYFMQFSPDGSHAYSLRGFKDVAPYGKHKDGRDRFVDVNKLQVTDMKQPEHFTDIITGLVRIDSADWRR